MSFCPNKKTRCTGFTIHGNRCLRYAPKGAIRCHTHGACKDINSDYHTLCRKFYNIKRCTANMSRAERLDIANLARQCAAARGHYAYECCGGLIDSGHANQIFTMNRLARQCSESTNKGKRKQRHQPKRALH